MSGKPQPHRIVPAGVPFAQIPHALCMDPEVTSAGYRVYGFLMKLANSEGRAWPGHRYVTDHVPMSRNTVARAIANLEATGWVTISRVQQAHTYTVHGSNDRLDLQYDRRRNAAGAETGPVQKPSQAGAVLAPVPAAKLRQTENQDRQPDTDTHEEAPLKPDVIGELGLHTTIDDVSGRRRDLLWEAFVQVHGEPATTSERGKYNRAVRKLRDAEVGPAEYPALVQAFTVKHNGLQPAVMTIANERVGELRHFLARGPVQGRTLDDAAEDARWAALGAGET